MRPLSIRNRLLIVALVTGVAALLVTTVAIGGVLERFVLRGLDQTLDTQAAVLARAVRPDGSLDRARVVNLPGFDRAGTGWAWRVEGPGGVASGGSALLFRAGPPGPLPHGPRARRPGPAVGEGRTSEGRRVHLRRSERRVAAGVVRITVAGPREIVDRPLLAARGTLALSLAILALGLAAATLIQLRYALRPMRRLRAAVAEVREGRVEELPLDQPAELRPLAAEINALVRQNAAGLAHARRHVANLAHGLKTPLAVLSLRLEREAASAETRALVAELDRRIAHHLRRARSGAAAVAQRARTPLAAVIGDLLPTIRQVHIDRRIDVTATGATDESVAVDRTDLEEMLGNLLDNAGRHAARAVRLSVLRSGPLIDIVIEDDGPGLTDPQIAQALEAGVRLDETGRGYGFGLGIATELAELYGGRLILGRSDRLGGLAARLVLPRAA